MLSVVAAASGDISLRTAQQPPGTSSVQRSIQYVTIGAPLRGVGLDEARGVRMRHLFAPTARAVMGCRLMPVQPRGRPDNSHGDGGPPRVQAG